MVAVGVVVEDLVGLGRGLVGEALDVRETKSKRFKVKGQ